MTKTKAADTKGRETNNKGRESGKARGQTKKIIKGILGETGKDRMYEEKGEGRRKRGQQGRTRQRRRTSQRGRTAATTTSWSIPDRGRPPTTTTAH